MLIPANVTDLSNRFVLGLRKEDFHLFEDGVEQTIASFRWKPPLSVGVVFDASGSMDTKLQTSIEAAVQFLKTMNPQDEAFLVEFSDKAELVSGFTDRAQELQNKLETVKPGGLTALLDGVKMALDEMKKAKNPRKAIVIVSDGGDKTTAAIPPARCSRWCARPTCSTAMGVFEPLIFLGMPKEEITGPRLLSEIANEPAGARFRPPIPTIYRAWPRASASSCAIKYVLAYSPKNQEKDGKYRKVEVKVTQPPGARRP